MKEGSWNLNQSVIIMESQFWALLSSDNDDSLDAFKVVSLMSFKYVVFRFGKIRLK